MQYRYMQVIAYNLQYGAFVGVTQLDMGGLGGPGRLGIWVSR